MKPWSFFWIWDSWTILKLKNKRNIKEKTKEGRMKNNYRSAQPLHGTAWIAWGHRGCAIGGYWLTGAPIWRAGCPNSRKRAHQAPPPPCRFAPCSAGPCVGRAAPFFRFHVYLSFFIFFCFLFYVKIIQDYKTVLKYKKNVNGELSKTVLYFKNICDFTRTNIFIF